MATVTADYRDRARIVFETRGRHFTNVRERGGDGGPIGYTSTELLLFAIGNCALGALMNHELLRDADVPHASAVLEASIVPDPERIDEIDVFLRLEVMDPALLAHRDTLELASCQCPLCNTFDGKVRAHLDLSCPAISR